MKWKRAEEIVPENPHYNIVKYENDDFVIIKFSYVIGWHLYYKGLNDEYNLIAGFKQLKIAKRYAEKIIEEEIIGGKI